MKKILQAPWFKNVITGILIFAIAVTLFIAYGSMNNRFYKVLVITSNSMSPVLKSGDLILITPAKNLKVGDIATFVIDGELVTHRIIATDPAIKTKGDSNNTEDKWVVDKVGGIYRLKIPLLGYPISKINGIFKNLFGFTKATFIDSETASFNVEAGVW